MKQSVSCEVYRIKDGQTYRVRVNSEWEMINEKWVQIKTEEIWLKEDIYQNMEPR